MAKYREPKIMDVKGCPCGSCGKKDARLLAPEWFVLGAQLKSPPNDYYVASLCASCQTVINSQPESFAYPMFDQAWRNTLEWMMCNGYFIFREKVTVQ